MAHTNVGSTVHDVLSLFRLFISLSLRLFVVTSFETEVRKSACVKGMPQYPGHPTGVLRRFLTSGDGNEKNGFLHA